MKSMPIKSMLMAAAFGTCLGLLGARATELSMDSEAECRLISQADMHGCRCRGLYYESRFGSDEGAAALHLVSRSYVDEPQVTAAALYERFGAAKLDKVAERILHTRDEVMAYCPFSAHVAD
jgi:hypothetical protein